VHARAVILVEGISDRIALEALALRRGRELAAEGVSIVPIGGAQAIGRALAGLEEGVCIAGLCDLAEEPVFRRALERAGFGPKLTRTAMEELGFYACVDDLEDELIRALGADDLEALLEANGHLHSFRTFQKQPPWRDRPPEAQLRRFLGSADSRKLRYARLIVESLELERMPRPLDGALAAV
jgi:hypothetical protein